MIVSNENEYKNSIVLFTGLHHHDISATCRHSLAAKNYWAESCHSPDSNEQFDRKG